MIDFFVPGIPKTAGSKRAFFIKKLNRSVIVDACAKSKDWQADVKAFAMKAYQGPLFEGPVKASFEFSMPRPKGHYGSGKKQAILKTSSPLYHTSKPDVLKMSRAIEDALTGIIWKDDSQVCIEIIEKRYGEKPGVQIRVDFIEQEFPF